MGERPPSPRGVAGPAGRTRTARAGGPRGPLRPPLAAAFGRAGDLPTSARCLAPLPVGGVASGRVREGIGTGTYEFPQRYLWIGSSASGWSPMMAPLCHQGDDPSRSGPPAGARGPAGAILPFQPSKTAWLSRGGLTIAHRREKVSYGWGEVLACRIRRLERDRRDFSSLEVDLPDGR